MDVRVVLVAYIVEEVNLVLPREKRGGDTVHGRISPALDQRDMSDSCRKVWRTVIAQSAAVKALDVICH